MSADSKVRRGSRMADGGAEAFPPVSPVALGAAFAALAPLLANIMPREPKRVFALADVQRALANLKGPLAAARSSGGLINPWAVAGLRRDEVRTAAALAGLWLEGFGGGASRRFVAEYLGAALPDIDWYAELVNHYQVEAECNPVGDLTDRVDLVVETRRHLVGIEVKIDAGLGPMQLPRYRAALDRRAELGGRTAHLLLLARIASPDAISTSWRDLAGAAARAVPRRIQNQTFVERYISAFGDYVRRF